MSICKILSNKLHLRYFSSLSSFNENAIDWDYLSNPSNFNDIVSNITSRKTSCDMKIILKELQDLHNSKNDQEKVKVLKQNLINKLFWLPNYTHPRVLQNSSKEPVLIEKIGAKVPFAYFPASFDSLTKRLNILRSRNLGNMSGSKSYFLKSDLALLEQSIVRYTISKLTGKGYTLISVPDILPKDCLESCGMRTQGKHSQVYHIYDEWAPNLCLSGTSEMAIAAYISGKIFQLNELPLKFCAVSRCYRAEANKHRKEKGIFRVHAFTKVEMFGVTSNESGQESEALLDDFVDVQREMYSELGLHFKILEMPLCELGLPAYHKIDMEAWIPSQKIYGEISSASNCTDYQSKRLNIKYEIPNKETKFCHTVNGTGCAIPRLLIAVLENFQNLKGAINVPIPLQKYMKKSIISRKFDEMLLCIKPIP